MEILKNSIVSTFEFLKFHSFQPLINLLLEFLSATSCINNNYDYWRVVERLREQSLRIMEALLTRKLLESLDEDTPKEGNLLIRRACATAPVILSAPHGGGDKLFPNNNHSMEPRLPEGVNVSMKSDLYTLRMLAAIDHYFTEMCHHKCYIIAATVHRRYVDLNRNSLVPEQNAYKSDCDESAAYYDSYHGKLAECIQDCKQRFPNGPAPLLLDIHGQARYIDMVVIGTSNRRTCPFDPDAGAYAVDVPLCGFIWNMHSLFGHCSLPHPGQGDIFLYKGGHIVCKYGIEGWDTIVLSSYSLDVSKIAENDNEADPLRKITAIQLEYGSNLRSVASSRSKMAILLFFIFCLTLFCSACSQIYVLGRCAHSVASLQQWCRDH